MIFVFIIVYEDNGMRKWFLEVNWFDVWNVLERRKGYIFLDLIIRREI